MVPGRRLASAGLGLALAALYLALRSWSFNFDGVCFAQHLESGRARLLFHPNHLLYSATGWLYWKAEALVWGPRRALPALQVLSGLCGAAAAAGLAALLSRRFALGRSLAAAAAFALSFGYAAGATDAQAYAPAALAALGPLSFLLAGEGSPVLAGAATAVFALYHQLGAFSALPLAWMFWRRSGPKAAGLYLACAGAPTLAVYAGVLALWPAGGPAASLRWLMGNTLPMAGGEPVWAELAHSPSSWLAKLGGLYAGMGHALLGPGRLQAAVVALFLAWLGWRTLGRGKLEARLWAWVGTYLFFLSLAHGLNDGYLVLALLPLPALVLAASEDRILSAAFGGLAVCALLSTLSAAWDWRRPEKNPDLARALELGRRIGPSDYLLFGGSSDFPMGRAYLPYFTRIDGTSLAGWFWRTGARDLKGLGEPLSAALGRGGRVYVSAGLLEPAETEGLERQFHLEPGLLRRALASLPLEPAGPGLARLRAGAPLPAEFR